MQRVSVRGFPLMLLAVIVIPLQRPEGWRPATYPNIPASETHFGDDGMTVRVRASSSPLFHALKETLRVRAVHFAGTFSELPKLSDDKSEGSPGADDFPLRVGLVVEGKNGPGLFARWFAPRWLGDVLALAPNRAFERVHFLTVAQRLPVGTRRRHPMSEYIDEEVVSRQTAPGAFSVDHVLREAVPAFALWVHADGDDTRSSYDVRLEELRLETD